MSQKKKKAPAAQNLIDSLLDEKTNPPTDLPEEHDPFPVTLTAAGQVPSESSFPEFSMPKADQDFSVETGAPIGAKDPVARAYDAQREVAHGGHHHEAEKTVRIDEFLAKKKSSNTATGSATQQQPPPQFRPETGIDRMSPTDVKTTVRLQHEKNHQEKGHHAYAPKPAGHSPAFSSAEASLKQSESLRIAQFRISELEQELERLRRENEQLATAGETFRRRADELLTKSESSDQQSREALRIFDEEKKVFRGQLQQKDRENMELRARVDEMEGRLESNFKKIRVRERELEHRLEIVRMESSTLVSTKDKMILELKRQLDQVTHENDYAKQKTQELFNQYKDKQETARRVVRALRIALTILEGDEDANGKKSE